MNYLRRLQLLGMTAADLTRYICEKHEPIGYKAVSRTVMTPEVGSVKTVRLIEAALNELEVMKNA